jgi:hypothetical protein
MFTAYHDSVAEHTLTLTQRALQVPKQQIIKTPDAACTADANTADDQDNTFTISHMHLDL